MLLTATASLPTAVVVGIAIGVVGIGVAWTVWGFGAARAVYVAYWRLRGVPRATETLSAVVTRAPQNLVLPNEVQFTTNDRPPTVWQVTDVGNLPTRIVFVSPERKTIYRARDLPAEVRGRLGSMRVSSFVVGGFVVEERGCRGDDVRVEVYFD